MDRLFSYMKSCNHVQLKSLADRTLANANFEEKTHIILDMKNADICENFQDSLRSSYEIAAAYKQMETDLTKAMFDRTVTIENSMHNLNRDMRRSKNINDIIAVATCYYNISFIYKDHNISKLRLAVVYLEKCLELLKDIELDSRAILVVMRATVLLEYILGKQDKTQECCPFSHKAIGLYLTYMKTQCEYPIVAFSVGLNIEGTEKHLKPMNSLSILYEELLQHIKEDNFCQWDLHTLVIPIHNLLMGQWEKTSENPTQKGIAWANAIYDFSKYFIQNFRFDDAEIYLATIQVIIKKYEAVLEKADVTEHVAKINTYKEICKVIKTLFHASWLAYSNAKDNLKRCEILYNEDLIANKTKESVEEINRDENLQVHTSRDLQSYTGTLPFHEYMEENVFTIANRITGSSSQIDNCKTMYDRCILYFEISRNDFQTKILQTDYFSIGMYHVSRKCMYLGCFEKDNIKRANLLERRIQILSGLNRNFGDVNHHNGISARINFEMVIAYAAFMDVVIENAEIAGDPFDKVREVLSPIVKQQCAFYECSLSLPDMGVNFRS